MHGVDELCRNNIREAAILYLSFGIAKREVCYDLPWLSQVSYHEIQ